jgi:hypothetical protein
MQAAGGRLGRQQALALGEAGKPVGTRAIGRKEA